jgi:hypothetical protein
MTKLKTAGANNAQLTGWIDLLDTRVDFSDVKKVFDELIARQKAEEQAKAANHYARLAGFYVGTLRCMLMYKDVKTIHRKIRKALKEAEKIK